MRTEAGCGESGSTGHPCRVAEATLQPGFPGARGAPYAGAVP